MILIELFLFSICLALTFTVSFKIKHPFGRAFIGFTAALAIAVSAYIDVRLVVVGVAIGFILVVLSSRVHGMFPLVPAIVLAVVMVGTPHVDDLLYLQSRYVDNFTYMTDGMYYSENMGRTILVSRKYGDTYQTYQFQEPIIENVLSCVPDKCEVREVTINPTQTKRLFTFYREYADAVDPLVYLYLVVPPGVELDTAQFPYQTKVVITV